VKSTDLDAPTVRDGKPRGEPSSGIAPGTELAGRYRILEQLGEGGMGVVYRARDLTLDLDVALKVLHPRIAHDPEKLAFFRNEVRVARMVTHHNVCRLHDLEDAPQGCFITMEHVAGESLAARLARGRIPLPEALRVLRDVARGLAAAHAAGVIHRDLKPSNILLASDRAIVADFGIAGERRALAAGPQDVAGTRGYMAPEQLGGARLDARVDVYALGVIAFVLVTGRHPPPAATPAPDYGPALDELPPGLAALISECLAAAPGDRPRDAGEVLRRLASPTPPRSRRWMLAAGLAAVAIAGATLALAIGAKAPAPAQAAPRIVLPAFAATALPARDRWLAAVVQRLVADELTEAWGLDVELGGSPHPVPGTVIVTAKLVRDPSGRLRLSIEGATLEATSMRELAVLAAAQVVTAHVPEPVRRPTAADLAEVGARDPEAWRLWRRAQHESLLLRWQRASALALEARKRDPEFPLATLELAMLYDDKDIAAENDLVAATELLKQTTVRPLWPLAATAARQQVEGDTAGTARTVAAARRLELTARERRWLELRWAMAVYFNDSHEAAAPALELLADTHPSHPTAFKLLAGMHLASDQPTAPTLALRYATRAAELAPDDCGARADLALALLLAGRLDEARARAAELAQLDPEDKRLARGRLFTLHMALGDLAEAERDARRQLSGSPTQRAEGMSGLAVIDLYWGRFDAGVRGLVAAADAYDAIGQTVAAARVRFVAGRQAWQLGDHAGAIRAFEQVAAGPTQHARAARGLARIVAGKLDDARAYAAGLGAGSIDRAEIELAIAHAARDPDGVLAAFTRIEKLSTTIEHLFATAEALERSGRLDDAARMFARLAGHTRAWTEPVASTRAWYRLGELRERTGDLAGARAALTEGLRRWGNATTRMPEVDDARRRLRRLDKR
jgi:tetratricopeptide (TPR) repeat protein